jgi:anti-sigma regulatory factor (Ser/Thr protein kinase)
MGNRESEADKGAEMNPGLDLRVRRRLPVTVVTATGKLETDTLPAAEIALRECLAQMPSAVVLDGNELDIAPSAHLWLLGLALSAARWPGTPLILTGPHDGLDLDPSIQRYATLKQAMVALNEPRFPERRQLTLPPEPSSCARARALVAGACRDWGMRRPQRLAELLISELVANGVMHAGTPLKITVRRRNSDLELSVRDHGTGRLPADEDMRDPRGFGLQLLAALSDSWGWSPAGRGKVVWTLLQGVA